MEKEILLECIEDAFKVVFDNKNPPPKIRRKGEESALRLAVNNKIQSRGIKPMEKARHAIRKATRECLLNKGYQLEYEEQGWVYILPSHPLMFYSGVAVSIYKGLH